MRSALAAFAAAGLLLVLYELAVVQPTQPGIIPDDYARLTSWEQIAGNLGRLPSIIQRLAGEYFLSARFGFPGLLLVAAALLFWRRIVGVISMFRLAADVALAGLATCISSEFAKMALTASRALRMRIACCMLWVERSR